MLTAYAANEITNQLHGSPLFNELQNVERQIVQAIQNNQREIEVVVPLYLHKRIGLILKDHGYSVDGDVNEDDEIGWYEVSWGHAGE